MVLQVRGGKGNGTHAVTYIREECTGRYRRYDNDGTARQIHNTFEWTTWDGIMEEWDHGGSMGYGVVPSGALLARTRQAKVAAERNMQRKRGMEQDSQRRKKPRKEPG